MSARRAEGQTPATLGFRMPAEWERHAATWLAWPHNARDWPGKFGAIPWAFAEIARAVARSERVRVIVKDTAHQAAAQRALGNAGAPLAEVDFLRAATDRGWTRDMGPIFLVREAGGGREVAATSWRFKGWAKYANFRRDDAAKDRLLAKLGLRTWQPAVDGRRVVLEGGAIEGNGEGTLLVTEECLLSPIQERNPGLTREGYEEVFKKYLGIRHTIWLGEGCVGDDTHGHIDDVARFVNRDTIVLAVEDDPADENHERSIDNVRRLELAAAATGIGPLNVVRLPFPRPVFMQGERLPASYANFYIANGIVVVPTFNDASDRVALNTLAGLFPDRRVIGIHAVDLVWGLGTLHCLTQQQPAGRAGA